MYQPSTPTFLPLPPGCCVGGDSEPATHCPAAVITGACGWGHGTKHECGKERKKEKEGETNSFFYDMHSVIRRCVCVCV